MARICIDGACWINRRGYGRYMRHLLSALWEIDQEHEYILLADKEITADSVFPDNVIIHQPELTSTPTKGARAGTSRTMRDLVAIGSAARHLSCDILFFPTVYSYFPYFGKAKVATVFHDCIADRYPEFVFPDLRSRILWKLKIKMARLETDTVITVSDYSRGEIEKLYGIPGRDIHIVSEAPYMNSTSSEDSPSLAEMKGKCRIPESASYFLYVGGFAPHKNLIRLCEAMRGAKDKLKDVYYIFVGDPKGDGFCSNYDEIQDYIRSSGMAQQCSFPGFLPDAELITLYRGALAHLMPSLSEGFGLPAVEAAAQGTPVIATQNSPLPKILEGGGIFCDPLKTQEIESGIIKMALEHNFRSQCGAVAQSRARSLSWTDAAFSLKNCFESMLKY